MKNTKIITGNAYLAIQKKQNFFSKEELNLILSLYGKGVSSGKWKDYAIDSSKIKEELGWKPKESFKTGIKKTILWYLNNKDWWKNIQAEVYNQERMGLIK